MQSELHLSGHAIQRMAQRGIAISDVDLILTIGSEVTDGYLVRRKDLNEFDKQLKALRDRVRRLTGKRLVVSGGGTLITVYHATPAEEQKLLKRRCKH